VFDRSIRTIAAGPAARAAAGCDSSRTTSPIGVTPDDIEYGQDPTLPLRCQPMSDEPESAPTGAVLPLRAPRLLGAVLDDEEVVFDPIRREAHLLNPTGSLLLARCDGTTPVRALVEELSATYGTDPTAVAADVDAALADFATRRLVGPDPHGREVAPVTRPVPGLVAPDHPVVLPDQWAVESPTLAALLSRVQVRSDDPVVGRYLDAVFASLFATEQPARHTFDIVTVGPGPIRLLLDGTEVGATTTVDAALSYLQWSINQLAVAEADAMALLHASAVCRGERVAIFPATSNSGKSTLAAGLVRAGLGYVTDETVAVDLSTGRVLPYPKPISLDRGSWPLFAEVAPSVADSSERFFENEWHLDPSRLHRDAATEHPSADSHVTLVAFPTHRAGAPTELTRMSRGEALMLLLENSFNPTSNGAAGMAALARIAATARVGRLVVGELHDAVDLIRTTL
jgi:PqqD family protein of HPr-rel-A system